MTHLDNYKLYDVLKTLDKKEIRQIKRMLQSPFFVLRKDVGCLFEFLIKFHLKDSQFPGKEIIFEHVFPKKAFDYALLRGTMSDLFERIEEYLLTKKRKANKIETRHLLAEIYRQRKLPKCYQTVVKKTSKLLESQPLRNEFYFRQLLDFQLEEMEFKISNQRTKVFNLAEVSETMDVLYLVQKLKHTCIQFAHQQVFKTDYNFGLLTDLIKIVEQERYLKYPAIAVYYYCYRFLIDPQGADFFQQFKKKLFGNHHLFDSQEMKELYLLAINFCIRKLNQGVSHFNSEILELYKDGLQAGYFLENGMLSRFTFNNIVAAGIRFEEFDWLEDFIESYANKLASEYRDSTVNFNRARLDYNRKNYGSAMQHLQNVEFKDLVNNLIAKNMLMKIYYELGEYDLLDSHLDSFQIFIRRREVSDFHRINFMNVIRWVKKLLNLPNLDKQIRIQLIKEIESEAILTERDWLLEKLKKRNH